MKEVRNMETKRIGVTDILGKEIVFYGSWEEPLFLGRDVANWIDHNKPSEIVDAVDGDEKLKAIVSHSGQRREMWLLTEDGLYEYLMQSRKPIAKELRKQIKQYLKQIRKTGGTVEEGREEEFIDKYFPSFSEDVKLAMVQDLLKTNKELKPKADYHDKVLSPGYLKTTTDIAKDLGMSAQKLHQILHDKGVIYPKKVNGKVKCWYLYKEYQHLVPEYADYHITQYNQVLKWTEKGRKFIIELLEQVEPIIQWKFVN